MASSNNEDVNTAGNSTAGEVEVKLIFIEHFIIEL